MGEGQGGNGSAALVGAFFCAYKWSKELGLGPLRVVAAAGFPARHRATGLALGEFSSQLAGFFASFCTPE
jgi:hypothetical protein